MPWDGSGNFILNQNFPADRDAGPPASYIQADLVDNELQNIKNGLENCVTRDGQNSPSADLPMATYKHSNVGAATGQAHYLRSDQAQKNTVRYLTSVGGTSDAITATAALSMNALTTGMVFEFIPGADNTTTTPTININSIGAKTFKKNGGDALVAGDIQQNKPAQFLWNGTYCELLNPYTIQKAQITDLTVNNSNWSGTVLSLANGGTGAALTDPNADRILFWDDSAGQVTFLTPGTGLSITGTSLDVTVTQTASSSIAGTASGLKIATSDGGTSNVITAKAITLQNSSGDNVRISSVNVTASIDTGSIATSTWYYIWVFYNPTTTTVTARYSTSSTAPTAPSGATYSARVGAARTKSGSATFIGSIQYGNTAQYVGTSAGLPVLGSGTASTWTAISVSAFVPSTASQISVSGYTNGGNLAVAPNNAYGSVALAPLNGYVGGYVLNLPLTMVLESTSIYWSSSDSRNSLYCLGWTDNL